MMGEEKGANGWTIINPRRRVRHKLRNRTMNIETICFHEWREAIDMNGVVVAMTCHSCGIWLSNDDDDDCDLEE
jgi:hypothetical protein